MPERKHKIVSEANVEKALMRKPRGVLVKLAGGARAAGQYTKKQLVDRIMRNKVKSALAVGLVYVAHRYRTRIKEAARSAGKKVKLLFSKKKKK